MTNRLLDSAVSAGSSHVFEGDVSEDETSVLIVDDDAELLDLTATFLEQEERGFKITSKTRPAAALQYLDESSEAVDAIVSDYDMPEMNGLDFLGQVRTEFDDIPFILFTAKGSEEIASKAISMGVTDYLQKEMGTAQYSVLANRLTNAVEQHRAQQALERSEEKFSKMVMNSTDFISIVSENGQFEYVSPSSEKIIGYDNEEMIGNSIFNYVHPEDRQQVMEEFFAAIEEPNKEPTIEFRLNNSEQAATVVESRGKNLLDDATIEGFVVNTRDITPLKEREWGLEERNKKLTDMRRALTHDTMSPLNVASSALSLYRDTGDEQYLDKIDNSVDRAEALISSIAQMAKFETNIEGTEPVSLREVVLSAWEMVDTAGAELHIQDSKEIEAEPTRLQQLFENLFKNATTHGSVDVTIQVGTTETGFYVEDTGPGIPEERREKVFEAGYTTESENTGFGLNIVKQIVVGHGWDITITDGETDGARFAISGPTFQPETYE